MTPEQIPTGYLAQVLEDNGQIVQKYFKRRVDALEACRRFEIDIRTRQTGGLMPPRSPENAT